MTKEEAIKILLEMRDGMPFDKCQDWIDATSIAIRSLEECDNLEKMASELYHGRHKKCPLIEVEDEVNDEQIH